MKWLSVGFIEEKLLGNIFLQVNTFVLFQDNSLQNSQARHQKTMRKAELAGSISSHFSKEQSEYSLNGP